MSQAEGLLAGVVGWPVSHSLSPRLHSHWIEQAGIDAAYVPVAVMPEDLEESYNILINNGFSGWNVTVPHKEATLTLVKPDALATSIGAVNTVIVEKDGTLHGTNTDAYGFIANLKASLGQLDTYKAHAMILGAGGAARAVAKALMDEGFLRITLANRTRERAELLAQHMGPPCDVIKWEEKDEALASVRLLVNTTTLGMTGQPHLSIALDAMQPAGAVCDIVYRPLMTTLLAAAKLRGLTPVTGIGMLIYQAVPGFEAWFGRTPLITPDLTELLLS